MRRYAMSMAAVGFFVMAGVGSLCDVPPLVCSLRALAGAAAIYVITMVCGKAVLGIIADAFVRRSLPSRRRKEASGERPAE